MYKIPLFLRILVRLGGVNAGKNVTLLAFCAYYQLSINYLRLMDQGANLL